MNVVKPSTTQPSTVQLPSPKGKCYFDKRQSEILTVSTLVEDNLVQYDGTGSGTVPSNMRVMPSRSSPIRARPWLNYSKLLAPNLLQAHSLATTLKN